MPDNIYSTTTLTHSLTHNWDAFFKYFEKNQIYPQLEIKKNYMKNQNTAKKTDGWREWTKLKALKKMVIFDGWAWNSVVTVIVTATVAYFSLLSLPEHDECMDGDAFSVDTQTTLMRKQDGNRYSY